MMNQPSLSNRIKTILEGQFVDYLGFADIEKYSEELALYGGQIVSGYSSAISIGIALPDSIVENLPYRFDHNIACEYRTHGYEIPNQRLNHIASLLSSFLNGQGYRTLPIPAADRADRERAIPTVSHKMIAHIAGMGWIGKSCLLVTPAVGPRLRLVSLLTDAPVDRVDRSVEEQCGECDACVRACPVGAIRGRAFHPAEGREERLDFAKCQQYLSHIREESNGVCGMCLYVCPHGRPKGNGQSREGEGWSDERG